MLASISSSGTPFGSVQGLSSGIQWQTLIDQMISAETSQILTPVVTHQTALQSQAAVWTSFQGLAGALNNAANVLRDASSFGALTAKADISTTTSRSLISASATTSAAPGTYGIQVLATAVAAKMGGAFVPSASAALNITGRFALNGQVITIAASDSLAVVRDKINTVNAGATPSGVSAAIVSTVGGSHLVLTSSATGVSGIEMVDDAAGSLQSLGFVDSTRQANITAAGVTQTNRISSSTVALGAFLGMSMPTASTIRVAGTAVNIDLTNDSLTTIAAKVNTATGNPSAASVQSETAAGVTSYRLVTNATVTNDAGVNLADSNSILSTLGFMKGGQPGVTQSLRSANTFVDANTTGNATGAALLASLQTNGQSLGIGVGDTINVSGTRGDGTAFISTLTVGAGSSMQNLLDAVSAATTGSRSAAASVVGGHIVLSDSTAGDSRLAVSLTVTKAGGGTTSLGAISTANGGTAGYSRAITSGADSQILVDGQLVTRPTNAIADAITGVTLNLLGAEQGTTVNLTLASDTATIVKNVSNLVSAYNNLRAFVKGNTADGAPLAHNSSLRLMASQLTDTLLSGVSGLTGSFASAAMVGLQHDKAGVLSLDQTVFTGFLKTNFADVKKLFALTGTPSDPAVLFITAGTAAKPSGTPYVVAISQAATQASVMGSVWATYATAGSPDTMTITDKSTGVMGAITIANGDTIANTVQRLNSLFATGKMQLQATIAVGSKVQITATGYGSDPGFQVAYTPGAGGNGTGLLGIGAQTYAGLDAAGTINGAVAKGNGQFLTAATGDSSEGVVLQYTGTMARAAGTFALSLGIGGAMAKVALSLSDAITGTATVEASNSTQAATDLQSRIADVQRRLDAHRAALMTQFLAMEKAMSSMQQLGASLASQITQLQPPKA